MASQAEVEAALLRWEAASLPLYAPASASGLHSCVRASKTVVGLSWGRLSAFSAILRRAEEFSLSPEFLSFKAYTY